MSSTETTPILLQDNEGKQGEGRLFTTHFDSAERGRRALLWLVGFWAAAGVSVLIPLAHFVLVPGFFLAGPVMAWRVWRVDTVADHAEGRCPMCTAEVTLPLEADDSLPKWTYCPKCKASLQLRAMD